MSLDYSLIKDIEHNFCLQGLPILQQLYPGHWIFSEHPSIVALQDCTEPDSTEAMWGRWSTLQWETFCSVSEHLKNYELSGMHAAIPLYSPPPTLKQLAEETRSRWTQWERTPEAKLNPCQRVATLHRERFDLVQQEQVCSHQYTVVQLPPSEHTQCFLV